ncbi:MAG: hypothetical protein V3V31_16245 [Methylococcales bacterium]
MGFFITNKETEDYLETETRDITMPDGSVRSFTGFKLMWYSFDYLTIAGNYTKNELVALAIRNAEKMGYSFEDSFPNVLAYIHQHVRKAQGIEE